MSRFISLSSTSRIFGHRRLSRGLGERLAARRHQVAARSQRAARRGCRVAPFCRMRLHVAVEPLPVLVGQVLGGDHDDRDRRARPSWRRSSATNSKPSISGIIRSSRISAGRASLATRRAPPGRSPPRRTVQPSCSSVRRSMLARVRRRPRPPAPARVAARRYLLEHRRRAARGRSAWSGSRRRPARSPGSCRPRSSA